MYNRGMCNSSGNGQSIMVLHTPNSMDRVFALLAKLVRFGK